MEKVCYKRERYKKVSSDGVLKEGGGVLRGYIEKECVERGGY